MGSNALIMQLCFMYYLSWLLPLLFTPSVGQDVPFKAVNLGGWLVTEGWMTPSLFDGITNKDLLDGTHVSLRSTKLNTFLAAENGGGAGLVADTTSISGWETFRLWRINETTFNLRVFNKQFVGLKDQSQDGKIVAISTTPGPAETFQIVRNENDPYRIRLRASNGLFLQAQNGSSVTADFGESADWGDQNPSVFQVIIGNSLHGEYQVTNGHGPDRAPEVMKEHWSNYIVEDDFRFMSEKGLTAVRIPVGWWIKYDQTPPAPFVGGSLQVLDNAFSWAEKYNLKVMVDLHGVPRSQNGNDHSAARDGYAEWGDSDINETVEIIEFLSQRYADRPSFVAIALMNEPSAASITLDTLTKYYKAGYDAVRRHSFSAYVILSNRLGNADNRELLPLGGTLPRSVIEVHYYNLFWDYFNTLTVQGNIDYVNNERAQKLREVTQVNGPLSFVGEWTGEWTITNATMEDYQRFEKAQLNVYGKATFGWAYWSYKCVFGHWSLKWMIENNYINLKS